MFFEQADMAEAIPAFATNIVGDPGICLVGAAAAVVGEVAMMVAHRFIFLLVGFNSIFHNTKYHQKPETQVQR